MFRWSISTLEDETPQAISSTVKIEATGSPETTNVVIPYLKKPPPSKPLRHIDISYVTVEKLGCSRTIHECEMCD